MSAGFRRASPLQGWISREEPPPCQPRKRIENLLRNLVFAARRRAAADDGRFPEVEAAEYEDCAVRELAEVLVTKTPEP